MAWYSPITNFLGGAYNTAKGMVTSGMENTAGENLRSNFQLVKDALNPVPVYEEIVNQPYNNIGQMADSVARTQAARDANQYIFNPALHVADWGVDQLAKLYGNIAGGFSKYVMAPITQAQTGTYKAIQYVTPSGTGPVPPDWLPKLGYDINRWAAGQQKELEDEATRYVLAGNELMAVGSPSSVDENGRPLTYGSFEGEDLMGEPRYTATMDLARVLRGESIAEERRAIRGMIKPKPPEVKTPTGEQGSGDFKPATDKSGEVPDDKDGDGVADETGKDLEARQAEEEAKKAAAAEAAIIDAVAKATGLSPDDVKNGLANNDPTILDAYNREKFKQSSFEYQLSPAAQEQVDVRFRLGPYDHFAFVKQLTEAAGIPEYNRLIQQIEDDYAVAADFYKERRDEIKNNASYPQWLKARRDAWMSDNQSRALTIYEAKIKNLKEARDAAEQIVVKYANAALDNRRLQLDELKFYWDQVNDLKDNDREYMKLVMEWLGNSGTNFADLTPAQQRMIVSGFDDPNSAAPLGAFDLRTPYQNKLMLDWSKSPSNPKAEGTPGKQPTQAQNEVYFLEWLATPYELDGGAGAYTESELTAMANNQKFDTSDNGAIMNTIKTTKSQYTNIDTWGSDDENKRLPGSNDPLVQFNNWKNKKYNWGTYLVNTAPYTEGAYEIGDQIPVYGDASKSQRLVKFDDTTKKPIWVEVYKDQGGAGFSKPRAVKPEEQPLIDAMWEQL